MGLLKGFRYVLGPTSLPQLAAREVEREREVPRGSGVLMQCLQEYPFDQRLMALNAADQYQRSVVQKLLPMAADK